MRASRRGDVDRFHQWLVAEGLAVLDAPAEYPEYGKEYYATFFPNPDGLKLEISFPKPLAGVQGDLRINSTYLPLDCFKEEAGLIKWPRTKTLSISVPEILARIGEKKIDSISVNLGAVGSGETAEKMPGRLLYANGQRVEPQTLQPRER